MTDGSPVIERPPVADGSPATPPFPVDPPRSEPAVLRFSGVALESRVAAPVGTIADLDVAVGRAAMTISGAGMAQVVPFEQFVGASCGEAAVLPDGKPAVVLSAVVVGRPLRWLIPAAQLPPEGASALLGLVERRAEPAPPAPVRGPTAPAASVVPRWADPFGSRRAAPWDPAPHARRGLLPALVAALVLLVVAAVVVPLTADSTPGPAPAPSRSAGDLELARQMNLQPSNVPAGWSVDSSAHGPLSGFLSKGGATGPPTSSERDLAGRVATQFETCMGITAEQDRIFGAVTARPSASSSSKAFAAPAGGSGDEVGSSVDLYASSTAIAPDVAQISKPLFPACFGAALGTSFVGAADSEGTSGEIGQPQVTPVSVPHLAGVSSAGVDVTIPVQRSGSTVPIQFGIVLVGGGRAEATLYTFAGQGAFPADLTASLAQVLGRNVVSESPGTAA